MNKVLWIIYVCFAADAARRTWKKLNEGRLVARVVSILSYDLERDMETIGYIGYIECV